MMMMMGDDESQSSLLSSSLLEECQCQICFELLVSPRTTWCGHSFCGACLVDALKYNSCCPACRSPLRERPRVNKVLNALLLKLAPEEYALRLAQMKEEPPLVTIGLFYVDYVLPGQRLKLHVFERRYKKLFAAALASESKSFGVLGHQARDDAVVTECEILDYKELGDGRFLCEVKGKRRLRLRREWLQEDGGFQVAECDILKDLKGEEDDVIVKDLKVTVDLWCEKVRRSRWRRSTLDTILSQLGPAPEEQEAFGFWIAALINPIPSLGVAPEIRLDVLKLADSRARLTLLKQAIDVSLLHLEKNTKPLSLLHLLLLFLAKALHTIFHLIARALALPLLLLAKHLSPHWQSTFLPLDGVGQ